MRVTTVKTERSTMTGKTSTICERNTMEKLKGKQGEEQRCKSVQLNKHY
jgi:hypothetical protein